MKAVAETGSKDGLHYPREFALSRHMASPANIHDMFLILISCTMPVAAATGRSAAYGLHHARSCPTSGGIPGHGFARSQQYAVHLGRDSHARTEGRARIQLLQERACPAARDGSQRPVRVGHFRNRESILSGNYPRLSGNGLESWF